MEPLRIYTFGGLRLLRGETPINLVETRKAEALLVYLAQNRRVFRREILADLLWDERSQQQALSNLRVVLASLRKHLDPYLSITRETVALNPEAPVWSDAAEFEMQLGTSLKPGQILSTPESIQIKQAVELYQGDFLEGFFVRESRRFDDWVVRERERLHRSVIEALHALVGYELQSGAYQAGIASTARLLELDPLDELGHRQMMQLLSFSGKRSEALAQFETCRKLLQAELGVEPSAETKVLYEKIRSAELVRSRPPLKTIRGYELKEQVGTGSYGAVYSAVQKAVGRDVAVKVILPQYANDPEFIRRFETEAQVVARLEHPHIVPLYDYWREPDGAYLVMRLLKGGNLETLLEAGPLEISRVLELVDQIAAGLAAAHRQGIVHRDLKPANILLDEAGNAYLSDFGIAKVLGENGRHTLTGQIIGTPFCLSPEQIRGEPVTPRSDLYSFGILLFELLTGTMPFPDQTLSGLLEKHLHQSLPSVRESQPELPVEIDQVLQRATAKDPEARFADALSLATSFRAAMNGISIPDSPATSRSIEIAAEVTNPFKGLRAFQEADAADFFGREGLTERLVSRLAETSEAARFLAVVGPSGSGKSSLVRAGLIPALRQGALPGSEKWFIVEMIPGSHPFDELEIGLLHIATQSSTGLMEPLNRDGRGIIRAARLVLPSDQSELLLVIDQFEEVFTLVEDKAEASRFLKGLYEAAIDPRSPVRVVITLRADFFDRPLMQPDFSRLVQERTEVVVPMSVEELERAIRKPAERVGVTLENGLSTAIVAEVMEQPGALPLLQYALTELFEQRQDHRLTLDGYQAIGGVQGVLERRAEEIFTGLTPAGQAAAQQIFLRLVTLGEGVEDTRRRALGSEIEAMAIKSRPFANEQTPPSGESSVGEVIEAFGAARLLSFDRDPLTRSPTVEIAHEALLREWGRLRGWLDESRGDVRTQRALGSAAIEWVKADRDPSFLLHGARLSQFESWSEQTGLALTGDERALLEASLAEREAQQAAEEARLKREAALELRSRNFLRTLVVVLLLATVGALVLAGVARQAQSLAESETQGRSTQQALAEGREAARATQQALAEAESHARATAEANALAEGQAAQAQARLATARELALASNLDLQVDPERSILLALQSLRTNYTSAGEEALRKGMQASRVTMTITGHQDKIIYLDQSQDGSRLATSSMDGTVKVWNASTGQELLSFEAGDGNACALSPDGMSLAAGLDDGSIVVRETDTGDLLLTLRGHTAAIDVIDFSPDGKLIASASFDGTIRGWDSITGELLYTVDAPTNRFTADHYLAFIDNGKFLLTADINNNNRIIDASTGREIIKLLPDQPLGLFKVSSDSSFLAFASGGAFGVDLWDFKALRAGKTSGPLSSLGGFNTFVTALALNTDGTRLAAGSLDSVIKVWSITPEGGQELMTLNGHNAAIQDLHFSPDSSFLVSVSDDKTIKVWDVTPGGSREVLTLGQHEDRVSSVAYSPNGARLGTTSHDGKVRIWDAGTGELLHTLTGHKGWVYKVSFHPDGVHLVTSGADNTVRTWDIKNGQELLTLEGHEDIKTDTGDYLVGGVSPGVLDVAYSPDGRLLASTGEDATARIWDAKSGALLQTLSIHPNGNGGRTLAFCPDGSRLAVGTDAFGPTEDGAYKAQVTIWDVETWQKLLTLTGFPDRVLDLAYSPDSSQLVTVGPQTIIIWDSSTGQQLFSLPSDAPYVGAVSYSPDGSLLVTAGAEPPQIWDLTTRQVLVHLPGHTAPISDVAFNPDGTRLATASRDRTVRVYSMDNKELMSLALKRLTRWFTQDECKQYLHQDTCPPR